MAHLEQGFANERGAKEVPERHEEVAAADAAQIESSVGPRSQDKDADKAMPTCWTCMLGITSRSTAPLLFNFICAGTGRVTREAGHRCAIPAPVAAALRRLKAILVTAVYAAPHAAPGMNAASAMVTT